VAKVNGSAEILDMGQARARLRPADLKPSEFATVGAYFSAVREAAGYSIDDLAVRTHIKPAYLNAIELMNLKALPSRAFALGFIKTYAEALGVDAAAAVIKFKENTAPEAPIEERAEDHRRAAPTTEAVEERERPLTTLIGFVAVLTFILFCAIMIALPKPTSTPYKLDATGIPGAVPIAPAQAGATVAPAEGAPPQPLPVTVEAKLVEGVEPVYPRRCETDAKEVETVEIAFNVTVGGLVSGERIASSTNACFNEAALNTARLWRFSPQTVDGVVRPTYDKRHSFEFKRP
jgi:TonB family protein